MWVYYFLTIGFEFADIGEDLQMYRFSCLFQVKMIYLYKAIRLPIEFVLKKIIFDALDHFSFSL